MSRPHTAQNWGDALSSSRPNSTETFDDVSPDDWLRAFTQANELLRDINADFRERNRMDRGNAHSRLSLQIEKDINGMGAKVHQLNEMLAFLRDTRRITFKEASSMERKLRKLENSRMEIKRRLSGSSASSALMDGAPARHAVSNTETDHTRGLDDRQLLQYQQRQLDQQDDVLDLIQSSVKKSKQQGMAIGDELDVQQRLLEENERKVDRTTNAIRRENRKIIKITKKQGICCLILIIILLIAFLVVMFATNFFGLKH
eukprot:gnl/Trimastix_PCT/1067.p1 GENE.gnl/Trimastix_PCT/1067~~gnl/Trimastix_PCT/1067.p1  ORF type:complete len:259 (-),score=66.88 gnl/Trimastix_PCT/1067:143-919(-)